MGKVSYFIGYHIPKTIKAQLAPICLLRRVGGVRGGGRGVNDWGKERIFFISIGTGKLGGKVVFLIGFNNLAQTGKIFLHWFDGNQFLTFPAKGMVFKVSCGG